MAREIEDAAVLGFLGEDCSGRPELLEGGRRAARRVDHQVRVQGLRTVRAVDHDARNLRYGPGVHCQFPHENAGPYRDIPLSLDVAADHQLQSRAPACQDHHVRVRRVGAEVFLMLVRQAALKRQVPTPGGEQF